MTGIDIAMKENTTTLEGVKISVAMRSDTESAMVGTVKLAPQVTSGVSAAQISKSPDRNASEVVRRVPGITIIEERFVIVRGLSQRYNNAWINGLAVPSTETDSRAFSFDLIPSSQLDNLLVYKSPSPEIPGDFSGGFVKITTKGIPNENGMEFSYSTGFNFKTQFNDFFINPGSGTDFLGFDAGKRPLGKDFPDRLGNITDRAEITRLTRTGFNNDWRIKKTTPLPDQRISFSLARRFRTESGKTIGNITAINYSNTFKSTTGIENVRYGTYDTDADKPAALKDYTDDQYSNDVRLGAMHNWSFLLNRTNRIEFKNLFNLLGRNRLTQRVGTSVVSGTYHQEQTEMLYSSRLTYTGQFSGTHDFENGSTLDWNAGYSYAGRNEPDRRIAEYTKPLGSQGLPYIDHIKRYFQTLHDHIASASADYKRPFRLGALEPIFKGGVYGEFQTRKYTPREFVYEYDRFTSVAARDEYIYLPLQEAMQDKYFDAQDKVYIEENSVKNYAYSADVYHGAAYAALDLKVDRLSVYAGARLESHNTKLTYDRTSAPEYELMTTQEVKDLNLLPSANVTYRFDEKHQVRAAYGRSVNRPEVRELAPMVYYDFDLFSFIHGNENLKTALVDNIDLRYEFYPELGETVSIGAFYKHFKNPIEWTFIDSGGTFDYLYENAEKATNWGFELDVRKKLDFMGLRNVALSLNAAWIESNVTFDVADRLAAEPDRPMQGQSPYIVNAGLYYSSEKLGLDAALLYNIVGKRIVGIGKAALVSGGDQSAVIPDSYEMPRNTIDLNVSKALGEKIELRLAVKDLLSQDIVYKQFPKFVKDGATYDREQITRRFNPGQSFTLGVSVKLNK
jgi:hypothetical protein